MLCCAADDEGGPTASGRTGAGADSDGGDGEPRERKRKAVRFEQYDDQAFEALMKMQEVCHVQGVEAQDAPRVCMGPGSRWCEFTRENPLSCTLCGRHQLHHHALQHILGTSEVCRWGGPRFLSDFRLHPSTLVCQVYGVTSVMLSCLVALCALCATVCRIMQLHKSRNRRAAGASPVGPPYTKTRLQRGKVRTAGVSLGPEGAARDSWSQHSFHKQCVLR